MDGSGAEALQSAHSSAGASPVLDLNRIIATFRRRLRLMLAVALLTFVPVVLFTWTATPRYTATASVRLDSRQQNVTDINAVLSGLPADSATVDTEVEILRSRSLADKVVAAQKLDQDPEFNGSLRKPGLVAQAKSLFGVAPPPAATQSRLAELRAHEGVVDSVLARLNVRRSGLTYLIDISFESENAAKAANIANAFAKQYLVEQLDAKFDATEQANTFLSERIETLRQQVQTAEAAVQQYKINNNLMSAEGATLTEQEISSLNGQLAAARAQQAEQDARLQIARAQMAGGSTGGDVGEALSSVVIQQLRAQKSQQSAAVADLSTRYGERHPELLKARRSLADIDTQIEQEIGRIISNLEASAQVARQRTASIEASVGRSRGTLAGSNRAAVGLGELERNAEAVRTLYESFLGRFKQTTSQEGIEESDARVVSEAKVPSSTSYPRKALNLGLGLLLALGAAVGVVVLMEALEGGLSVAEDVERELGLPCLGSVPTLGSTLDDDKGAARRLSPVDYVVERPLSSFAEAFRSLRASLLYSRVGEKVQVITVTSSLPGEGKTTTSICLARTLAISGSNVLVVDCDLRQRAVNRILASDPKVGLLEVLNGVATLDQALVRDEASGAMILPLARSAHTAKDVFGTAAMRRLMEQLRARFDLVVLDTAPILPVADTRVLAPLSDVVVVLARWRKTPRKAVEATLRLLGTTDCFVAGVALTQVNLREQARYGYGDPGYYYKSYRKYYGG